MEYYIRVPRNHDKATQIIKLYGGKISSKPPLWQDLKPEEAVICVVDNGAFEAAAFAYSEAELKEFSDPSDDRPKTWVIMDRIQAEDLTHFTRR